MTTLYRSRRFHRWEITRCLNTLRGNQSGEPGKETGILPTPSQTSAPSENVRRDLSAPTAPGEWACRSADEWHASTSRQPPEKGPRVVPLMAPMGSSEEGGSQWRKRLSGWTWGRVGGHHAPICMETTRSRRFRPNQSITKEAKPGLSFPTKSEWTCPSCR